MHSRLFIVFVFLAFTAFARTPLRSPASIHDYVFKLSPPFAVALETLQKQIEYKFKNILLLRRAMTHPSYSEENNRALSILGASIVETAVALRSLGEDIEMSANDLNRRISEVSRVEESCAADGMRLGLDKIVRVSPKTNLSASVVCGAFRAMFGAVALDSGKSDDAITVFSIVHRDDIGSALSRE